MHGRLQCQAAAPHPVGSKIDWPGADTKRRHAAESHYCQPWLAGQRLLVLMVSVVLLVQMFHIRLRLTLQTTNEYRMPRFPLSLRLSFVGQ